MKYRLKLLLLSLVCVLFQTGCNNQAVYTDESFASDSPFKMKVDGEVAAACESVRRSLLGQGYLIDLASSEEVKGRKAARGEGKQNTFIEMNVVCVPERSGSTIFATGVLSTYALKTNSSSASVGLSALGSISLPIGQSVDSLVKVSEETIDDKDFYKRFFAAVDSILGEIDHGEPVEETVTAPVEEPITYDPTPATTPSAIWPALFPEQDETTGSSDSTTEQAAPELAPEPLPAESAPVATPPSAVDAGPVGASPMPAPSEGVPSAPSAPAPDAQPLGMPSAAPQAVDASSAPPVPAEEPMGISPVAPAVAPDEEPMGIPPAPVADQGLSGADESELAPARVTAVKKAVPKSTIENATPPVGEPQQAPASSVDNLF